MAEFFKDPQKPIREHFQEQRLRNPETRSETLSGAQKTFFAFSKPKTFPGNQKQGNLGNFSGTGDLLNETFTGCSNNS